MEMDKPDSFLFVHEFSTEAFKTGYNTAIGVLKVTMGQKNLFPLEERAYREMLDVLEKRFPNAVMAFQMELMKLEIKSKNRE